MYRLNDPPLDETPAEGREWGFYPNDDEPSHRNPPSFTWRPQSDMKTYTLQVAGDPDFQHVYYERSDLVMNVHTPPVTFEAENWLWFAMNVFTNVYPVWSDSDGGWFEGLSYWQSYLNRFTWWADIMCSAMDVDAFEMPYFSQAGYFPMYIHPPGTPGGGFGDHAHGRSSSGSVPLMQTLAAQASNPYWQWFVEQHEGADEVEPSYVVFVRGSRPLVEAKAPEDLPDGFERSIIFIKPSLVVLIDRLKASKEFRIQVA